MQDLRSTTGFTTAIVIAGKLENKKKQLWEDAATDMDPDMDAAHDPEKEEFRRGFFTLPLIQETLDWPLPPPRLQSGSEGQIALLLVMPRGQYEIRALVLLVMHPLITVHLVPPPFFFMFRVIAIFSMNGQLKCIQFTVT